MVENPAKNNARKKPLGNIILFSQFFKNHHKHIDVPHITHNPNEGHQNIPLVARKVFSLIIEIMEKNHN